MTKKYIARVVGFKRLVGRSADPTFLEAQAKFDLQKKMQKLLVSSEKEKKQTSCSSSSDTGFVAVAILFVS